MIKEHLNFEILSSIDWQKVLEADLFWLKNNFLNKSEVIKRRILGNWYRDFVFSNYEIEQSKDVDIVFFRFLVRDDYKRFFEDVASQFSGKKLLIQDYKGPSERLNLEASRWLNYTSKHLPNMGLICHLAKACLAIKFAMYLFTLRKVLSNKFRAIVLFADMQPVENLIAQYCKKLGINTVTMQHGLYVEYKNLDTINKINYENVVSDYLLAWGRNTCQLVAKYNKEVELIICGKPELQMSGSKDAERESNYILAVLDQWIFDNENKQMLRILFDYSSKKKLPLRIKFHPSNNKKEYIDEFPNLVEGADTKAAKFVVGHTTSLIYEAMRLGCRVARFQSNIPAIRLDDSLEFNTLAKFESIIEAEKTDNDGTEFIEVIGDESRKKYQKSFNYILQSD